MNKSKIIYLISGIIFIISFMNIFLGTILYKNLNIELYDISVDIGIIGAPVIETLENQSNRRAQTDTGNNGNSGFDYNQGINKEKEYNASYNKIINEGLDIEECYSSFTDSLEIDKCVKNYKTLLIGAIGGIHVNGAPSLKVSLIKNICEYGQSTKEEVTKCVTTNYLKKINVTIFQCSDIFTDDKDLELACFQQSLNDILTYDFKTVFTDGMLKLHGGLIDVDSKGRIITVKLNEKILKEHPEYATVIEGISPFFIDLDILEKPFIKDNTALYTFLKGRVQHYNSLEGINIIEHSTFFQDNPTLQIMTKPNEK